MTTLHTRNRLPAKKGAPGKWTGPLGRVAQANKPVIRSGPKIDVRLMIEVIMP
jgi:hypothetical protein